MKICKKGFKSNSSGQLLIVAALAIAILISSTTIYVYEVSKETNNGDFSSTSDFILATKQSTRNAVISSLANVSNGRDTTVLITNLEEFSRILRSLRQFGICQLDSAVFNDSLYDSGIWLSWGTSGIGVSSAYANFTFKVYGSAESIAINYDVNITTAVTINGYFNRLIGDEKLVNLTCEVYNEGEPALAKNITISYEILGSWMPVNSSNNLSLMDYGNSTYTASFTVDVPSDSLQVSVRVYDLRDIFVQANTTCYEP